MATTKTESVLLNDVTLVPATPQTSSVLSLTDGYGGSMLIRITNGGTGPTLAAEAQVEISYDNSQWYSYGGAFVAGVANSGVYEWPVSIQMNEAKHARVTVGENTAENVTVRVEGMEVEAVA